MALSSLAASWAPRVRTFDLTATVADAVVVSRWWHAEVLFSAHECGRAFVVFYGKICLGVLCAVPGSSSNRLRSAVLGAALGGVVRAPVILTSSMPCKQAPVHALEHFLGATEAVMLCRLCIATALRHCCDHALWACAGCCASIAAPGGALEAAACCGRRFAAHWAVWGVPASYEGVQARAVHTEG